MPDPPGGWKDLAEGLKDLSVRLQVYDPGSMSWVPLELPLPIGETVYTTRIAEAGGYTYIGKAVPASAETDPVWRISRVDASGNTLFADGVITFTKRWDQRITYTYT